MNRPYFLHLTTDGHWVFCSELLQIVLINILTHIFGCTYVRVFGMECVQLCYVLRAVLQSSCTIFTLPALSVSEFQFSQSLPIFDVAGGFFFLSFFLYVFSHQQQIIVASFCISLASNEAEHLHVYHPFGHPLV